MFYLHIHLLPSYHPPARIASFSPHNVLTPQRSHPTNLFLFTLLLTLLKYSAHLAQLHKLRALGEVVDLGLLYGTLRFGFLPVEYGLNPHPRFVEVSVLTDDYGGARSGDYGGGGDDG